MRILSVHANYIEYEPKTKAIKDAKEVENILIKKGEILPKKLHSIKLTREDLLDNLKKKQEAMIDIVKNAVILYGQDKYTEVIKDVTAY